MAQLTPTVQVGKYPNEQVKQINRQTKEYMKTLLQ
jgi:hypothetical protein